MLAGWLIVMAVGADLASGTEPIPRPNIVLILTDDQGYGDVSCHGNPVLKTPNMDRLASSGVEFTRFYVCPVCAPTRGGLLTGRWPLRVGPWGVTQGQETMHAEEVTLAEMLRSAGYHTALFGKWHLGEHYPFVPHAQGFEQFLGFRTGHWNHYFDSPLELNGQPKQVQGYISDALTDAAMDYIRAHREDPFFVYLAYNAPHAPYQVPAKYADPFLKAGVTEPTASVYGMIENLDENIARLLQHLESLNLREKTLVIFLTDNGPNGDRFTSGLRGRKGSVYEGGCRVPSFWSWPGQLPAGRQIEQISSHVDVVPTLLKLCQVEPPRDVKFDGRDLSSLWSATPGVWEERFLYTHRESGANPSAMYPGAIRSQRYNLVNGTELYDLQADPGEQKNVALEHPELTARLRAEYERWYRDVTKEKAFLKRPIPVGYAEENPVLLPATQSRFTRPLRFRGKNGFAHDWLVNWTSAEGRVSWDLNVVQPGDYEVTLGYRCEIPGGQVKATLGGHSLIGRQSETGPLIQANPHDRVPRTEVPSATFRELKLGTVTLPAGPAELLVQALTWPGETALELGYVKLLRKNDR